MSFPMQKQPLQTANPIFLLKHTHSHSHIHQERKLLHKPNKFKLRNINIRKTPPLSMASEQPRRENITKTEKKIYNEKDDVPQVTTRVEHLSVNDELPQGGSIEGDIGARGKARQSHELGPNVQSLPDRSENQTHLDHARVPVNAPVNANVAENRVGENAAREKLDNRTRVVSGTPHVKEQNIALRKEPVVAERGGETVDLLARGGEKIGRGRVVDAENQDAILEKSVAEEEKERARERAKEATKGTLSNTGRAAQEKAAQAKDTVSDSAKTAAEKAAQAKDATKDTVSNAAKTAAEKAAQAKEASKDTVSSAAKTAAEKAAQAKDATLEKGQQGYEATKGTVSNAAKTAAEKAAQAKNATLEKTQQGYEATKDTVSNAAKTAADYTAPVAEKTKTAAEKAKCAVVQAKDVTVEKGKTAAEMAGKAASAAGWTATHYATQLTVDGTKAAANAVEGAVGYVAPKASELAAKSVETVKGLVGSAGETAKEYTARKKDESWREYEGQKASQPKEGEETLPSSEDTGEDTGENVTEKVIIQKVVPSEEKIQAQGTNLQGRGSNVIPNTGETETVEKVLVKEPGKGSEKMEKKALGKKNEGAVTETI